VVLHQIFRIGAPASAVVPSEMPSEG
jgi:hypothetical protein